MENAKPPLQKNARRHWFVALIACYVLVTYLVPSSTKVERFSLTYFALIVPAWAYVLANWRYLLTGYTTASRAMVLFAILSVAVGLLRWDISLIYNVAFLSAVVIIVLNTRDHLTVTELNWLFLCAVIGSVAVYALGATEYGFIPGQAEGLSCHAKMNWRISLFRVTAESAMFSFVVLIANFLYGGHVPWWRRGLVVLLATYFLVFSGVRSIVFPALILISIISLIGLPRLPSGERRRFYVVAVVAAMMLLSVPYFLNAGEGFWKSNYRFWKSNYTLRVETCDYQIRYSVPELKTSESSEKIPSDWYAWTFNRHCAAMHQLSVFADSPLGNQEFRPKSDQQLVDLGCPTDQLRSYCGNCNFVTYWLARAGIFAIPLFLCFLALLLDAVRRRDTALAGVLVAFGIVSFSWGVMFVPFGFVFLLIISTPALASLNHPKSETYTKCEKRV